MSDITSIESPTRWPANLTYAEPVSDTPLGDAFTAAERAQRLGGNIVSEAAGREEAYDRRIEAVRQVTGVTLENPERLGYAREARGHLREDMRNGDLSPIDESAGVAPYRRRVFDRKVAELQAKHPELEFGGIDEEASALGAEAQQNLARTSDQPGNPILKFGAQMAGSMWGQRRDPLLLGTIFAGPSMAIGRTALAKIATEALGLGVFNAGLTGGEQYAIQDWLAKTGQPTGIGPAAQEASGAFVGGVGLGVAGGVLGEALKAAFKTAWPAAARVLRGQPEPGDVKTATEALAPQPAAAPREAPIVALKREAAGIEQSLPQPQDGFVRLWRGNRPGEAGQNPSFTSDLPGIALPFRKAYGGDLTYIDVPVADLAKYESTSGAAPGAEFIVPKELASTAKTVTPAMAPADIVAGSMSLPERAMQAGEDSLAADKAVLTEKPPDVPAELHDDLVAAALKRADDPEAPSPEAVAAIEPAQKPIDPELADRIEQANPRNPREAMTAADQALDDFGRRDGMAALQEKIQALKEARDAETEEWRASQERPGDEDIRSMVPMQDRNGNDVMRAEQNVRRDGDTEQGTADLIRECK